MELLDYENFEIKPTYDEKGFLDMSADPLKYYGVIFKNYIETKSLLNSPIEYDYLVLHLLLKTRKDQYYSFNIRITENWGVNQNVAYGDVEIYYDKDGIQKILVNGVENGYLRDLYKDNFDISPEEYIHILYKNLHPNL